MDVRDEDFGRSGGVNGGSGGGLSFAASAPAPQSFDFDLSRIGEAVRRGNTAADVESAYQTFLTGQPTGRGGTYAQDVLRRFSPGLTATYGVADIRTAAANYLDSAGLPRLAATVAPSSPTPGPDTPEPDERTFFPLPVPPIEEVTRAVQKPIEILADVFQRAFGNAIYNPPLQSQATSYTPYETGAPSVGGGGGGMNIGGFLILGVIAIVAYFVYKQVKGA